MSLLGMKNRSINVKVVKDPINDTDVDSDRNPFEGVEVAAAYAEVAKGFITHAALTIGAVYAGCKIVERICK